MGSNSVEDAHIRNIQHYYTSLKTFFDVTGVSDLNRETSSRAQKARAKLLKLSFSQFYELSTDVSDELKRRINEDQNKPEYLLPKANFHMKRNQARQKLANLSQTRFNELVDDILFEIQRRGFNNAKEHVIESVQEPETEQNEPDLNGMPIIASRDIEKKILEIEPRDTNSFGSSVQPPATASSMQPSLVIPKKASIDWSSSEDDGDEDKDFQDAETNEDTNQLNPNSTIYDTAQEESLNDSSLLHSNIYQDTTFTNDDDLPSNVQLNGNGSSLQQKLQNTFGSDVDEPNNDLFIIQQKSNNNNLLSGILDSPLKQNDQHQEYLNKTPDAKEIHVNSSLNNLPFLSSSEKFKSEKQNIFTHDKEEIGNANTKPVMSTTSSSSHFQNEMVNLNSEIRNLSIENETLKQKLSEMEIESKFRSNASEMTEINLLSHQEIVSFTSADGIVPIELINALNSNISNFFSIIKDENSASLGNELFEALGKLSKTLSQVFILVDITKFKDQVKLLKVSFSHLISTIRYYSIYHNLLPRITVYSAITEVSFAVCNLIDVCKIKNSQAAVNIAPTLWNQQVKISNEIRSPIMNKTEKDVSTTPVLKSIFTNPLDIMGQHDEDIGEDSPVKPLKITQKIGSQSPNLKPKMNTGIRQPSNSGLFSLMIDQERNHSKSPSVTSNGISSPSTPFLTSKNFPKADIPKEQSLNIQKSVTPNVDLKKDDNRTSNDLSISIENIFGNNDKNDDDIIKTTNIGKINDVSSETKPLAKLIDSENNSKKDISEEPTELNHKGDDEDDQTFLALRQVQGNKKMETEKGKENSLSITENTEPVETSTTVKPIKINKLESASIKRVNLNKVNTNSPRIGGTTSTENIQIPERNQDHVIDRGDIENDLNVAIPKRHESRLTHAVNNPIQVKKEETETPIIKKEITETPIIKKEVIETPIIKNEEDVKIPDQDSEYSDNEEEDSSYQFMPLKPETDDKKNKNIQESDDDDDDDDTDSSDDDDDDEEDFDVDAFDIENPDNTLSELLLYLEHQTVDVISTIQSLLSSIKEPESTKGKLRTGSNAINQVIGQMVDATDNSMNQNRNANLKEHGNWVVQSLQDCARRMTTLCHLDKDGILKSADGDNDYADKNFKQRLAGIAFDVAKCTKELVKTVEEASLKEEIEFLNSRIH